MKRKRILKSRISTLYVGILISSVCMLLLIYSKTFAQDEHIWIGEGMANIDPDPVTARDRALVDARVKAAESLGAIVDANSIVDMGMLVDQFAQVKAMAFVRAYEIIGEWKEKDVYRVKIRAWVKRGKARESARKELLSTKRILMLAEGKGADKIEGILKNRLTDSGFFLLDGELIRNRVDPVTWRCLKTGDASCVGEGFFAFLADSLIRVTSGIHPSQDFDSFKSYNAKSEIICTQMSTARVVVSTRKDDIVFGRDENNALRGQTVNHFGKKIAEPLCAEFMRKLTGEFGKRERDILVKLDGLPDKNAFDRFKHLVRRLRWVKDISNEKYASGTASLSVRYPEKTIYLASMIGFRTLYSIRRYARDMIDVVYSPSKKL